MRLPRPLPQYDQRTAEKTNELIQSEFSDRRKNTERLILTSPNGTPYVVGVTDAGALEVTPA